MPDSYQDSRFSYQSDVSWLAEQGRPFYYGIIFILLYFEFYLLAIFYAFSAITLIWDLDEGDAIQNEIDAMDSGYSDTRYKKDSDIINLVIMTDYLENVVVDIPLQDYPEFVLDYYAFLDSFIISSFSKEVDYFHPQLIVVEAKKAFNKDEISKIGEELNKFMLKRERNKESMKAKLMKFKADNLNVADPKKRALAKARMKKVMAMASQLEEDLLLYKISVEAHNTVLLALYLQAGLYPVTLYDVDLYFYLNFDSIIYSDYLFSFFFYSSYCEIENNLENNFNNDFNNNFNNDFSLQL